ncbi:YjeF domain-containing protein [Paracoccidioides lutzii Pb01]|uniref:ATP-dependent (S)-NAD(P)H-hydrate dehydratase n=1 Tax=Paracoccidioides lutzii (strain ATCC MYA-826 / Pb01) TaxID=502779 RepID=C1H264_PARBA|nr:YjeF domain-containing protein [Paracoccidioides lutzii Pb01]EEH33644.2 YjeF domain-containing protein [Paracoccidioides lutzii Pb01]
MPNPDTPPLQQAMSASSKRLLANVRRIIPPMLEKFHKGQLGRVAVIGGSPECVALVKPLLFPKTIPELHISPQWHLQDLVYLPPFTQAFLFLWLKGAPELHTFPLTQFSKFLIIGCDMSHVICEPSAATVIKSYSPNLMVHPILQSSTTLSALKSNPLPAPDTLTLAKPIISFLPRLHVLVIGPGLGRDPTTQQIVIEVLKEARSRQMPVVLDADALLLIQEHPDLVRGYPECILTPNVIEFARLVKAIGVDVSSASTNDAGQSEACKRLSNALGGVTIIQKGAHDIISNGITSIVSDVRGGLKRSGGQGDTLTGTLGTMLAWRKAYHEGLWDTGESEAGERKAEPYEHDIEKELFLSVDGCSGGNGKRKKLSPPATLLLAAWAGSAITRECSRKAFVAKGRSMQASDLTDEVHGSFLDLIGEPGGPKL